MTITITNKMAQNIVNALRYVPEEVRFSRAQDFMCEECGYFNHAVARELVLKSLAPRSNKACRILSHSETLNWNNSPAYTFEA